MGPTVWAGESHLEILVVGSVAYDTVETPAGKRKSQLGGSACYFSVSASYFTKVGLIGVIGDDFDPDDLIMLKQHGVDTSGLTKANGKTFRWQGDYLENINRANTIDTQLNVFGEFDPKLSKAHTHARFLFLANINPILQTKVLDSMAKRPKLVACDTMNLWIDVARPALTELISRVDILMINEDEAKQLTDEQHLPNAARTIIDLGPDSTVIKRGESGVALFGNEFSFAAPAYPLDQVIDPTGAGDSFAGGFLGYLASADNIDEGALRTASIVGSTMASFAVEDFGLERIKNLTRQDIESRFNDFIGLTRFDPMS